MWKKALLVFSLFAFVATVSIPFAGSADAKPRSFSGGKKSYSKTPSQPQSNVNKSDSGSTTSSKSTGTTSTTKPGFFGGGSFMKGMMIGGLTGLLFGSMFGGMGAFGNMLGFLINVMALVVLFMVIRAVVRAIMDRKRTQRPNSTDRRW